MAGSFNFAILRFAPQDMRNECLNVGLAVFGKTSIEFHFSKGLEKLKALSRAVDIQQIVDITNNIAEIDTSFLKDAPMPSFEERCKLIENVGILQLGSRGEFLATNSGAYQSRIIALLKTFVDPEPAAKLSKEKRSRILTDLKRVFRSARVLAKKNEDLSSHRIVPSLIIDEGLTADLVLKNGAFHVTETVDASSEDASLRKLLGEVGVASLVLERARMSFQNAQVKTCIVYAASRLIEKSLQPGLEAAEHQGAQLINWESQNDRAQYIEGLISLAVPYEDRGRKGRIMTVVTKHSLLH